MLFGRRELTLSAGKGTYFVGVGPFGRTRRFAYNHNTQVTTDAHVWHGRHGARVSRVLTLTTEGDANRVHLCGGFSEDAVDYAAAIIRRECRRA